MRAFESLQAVRAAVGEELGTSGWRTVTQEQVNLFADATGDHQWIHVDPERAATGPFGATIAHGYLTLALLPVLVGEIFTVTGITAAINYGCNRVRFPAPLPVGSRVRAAATLQSADEVSGGLQLVCTVTVDVEGGAKPCCVAESVTRLYG